jgi:hypothetical protein
MHCRSVKVRFSGTICWREIEIAYGKVKAKVKDAAEGRQSEADIDTSLLEDSLRLTPWQRLIENDRALALVRMLEDANARENGTSQSNSRTAES